MATGLRPSAGQRGYGLSGMRARVDEAGGTVPSAARPAKGTSVHVEVPTW